MNWPTPPTLAPRRQESGCSRSPNENLVAVLVVLCGAFDHRDPWLTALHPDLGLGRQVERCFVEPNGGTLWVWKVGCLLPWSGSKRSFDESTASSREALS